MITLEFYSHFDILHKNFLELCIGITGLGSGISCRRVRAEQIFCSLVQACFYICAPSHFSANGWKTFTCTIRNRDFTTFLNWGPGNQSLL